MIVDNGPIPNYKDVIDGLAGEDWAELATEETWRQDHPQSPHKDTETVYLNMADIECERDVFEATEAYRRQLLVDSPKVQDVILDCMAAVGACQLGRVMLVNLKPGGFIPPHTDAGKYCEIHRRYHLPIITNDQVEFTSEGETYYLEEGTLYELENKKEHSVHNKSDKNRLHLLIDMQLISEL